MTKPTQHPSGKPIHRDYVRQKAWTNVPHDDPLTPGLRRKDRQTYAVGFRAHLMSEDDEAEG